MGQMLDGLLKLQSIEQELAQVRRRLRTRQAAVDLQQRRIDEHTEQFEALQEKATNRRKDADRHELDLRDSEEQVAKLRSALNTAKTNKEYAAILTQINTLKADNAKLEEAAIKIIGEVDTLRAEADKIKEQIDADAKRLDEIKQTNAAEIERLDAMMQDLQAKRDAAAVGLNNEGLAIFERVAERYDGEAMAAIQVEGKKPPYDYICGGCYMSLNAEHANALRSRDEIRICNNCGRILYIEPMQP